MKFDKTQQYGDYVITHDGSSKALESAKSSLIPLMEKFIPEEFRQLVKWITQHWPETAIRIKDDNYEAFGLTKGSIGTTIVVPEHWTIAWKYTPNKNKE